MFVEQTLINTKNGYKTFAEINQTDAVLSMNGEYVPIGSIQKTQSNGVYRIQTQGNPELYVSGDTMFCVRRRKNTYNTDTKSTERKFSAEKWVKAKDLTKDDFVLISKNRKITTNYTKEIAWLYAKYFLTGFITRYQTVVLKLDKSLFTKFKKMAKGMNYNVKELKNVYKIEIFDEAFYQLCSSCKLLINNEFIQANDAVLKTFIMSLVENTEKNENNYYVIKSKNRKYIYQIAQIISNINSFGGYSLFLSGEEKVSYRLLFNDVIPAKANFVCIGNKLYQPVRSVTEISAHRGILYDLDNLSFSVNNIISKGSH